MDMNEKVVRCMRGADKGVVRRRAFRKVDAVAVVVVVDVVVLGLRRLFVVPYLNTADLFDHFGGEEY